MKASPDQKLASPEMLLQLEQRSHVERLQILAHNTLIPNAIEIQLGDVPGGDLAAPRKNALFMSLGEVPWESNVERDFKGRQMQTIEVQANNGPGDDVERLLCRYVKLILKRNHINRKNDFNQVAIMAVNLLGVTERHRPDDHDDFQADESLTHRDDLSFLMYTDPDMVEVINKLESRRTVAIGNNRPEYAKKLRHTVAALEREGAALGLQLALKSREIGGGEYEDARRRREEIHRRRDEIYRHYSISTLLEQDGWLQANDERVESPKELPPLRHKNSRTSRASRSASPIRSSRSPLLARKSPLPPPRTQATPPTKADTDAAPIPEEEGTAAAAQDKADEEPAAAVPDPDDRPLPVRRPEEPEERPLPVYEDERPLPARKKYSHFEPSPTPPPEEKPNFVPLEEIENRPLITDQKPNTPKTPEQASGMIQLSSYEKKELQVACEVYSTNVIREALDKNAGTKESATEKLHRMLVTYDKDQNPNKPGKVLKGTTLILVRLLRDKVFSVFSEAVKISDYLFGNFVPVHGAPEKELRASAVKIYAELLTRTADTFERVQEKAESAIKTMIGNDRVRKSGKVTALIISPLGGPKEPPKICITKCDLVLHVMSAYATDAVGKAPLTLAALTQFGISAIGHTSVPVRHRGERILKKLYELDWKVVKKALPADNPQNRKISFQYRTLYEDFAKMDEERKQKQAISTS